MAKEVMSLTRDLFDEMLEATRIREQQRIIELLEDAGLDYAVAVVKGDNG
jgi:hypothetical protein